MKQYFYEKNGEQIGPVSMVEIENQIRANNINSSSLIWFQGLDNWKRASEIEELKDKFVMPPPLNIPPPIPPRNKDFNQSQSNSSDSIEDIVKQFQPYVSRYWKQAALIVLAILLIRSCDGCDFSNIFSSSNNTEGSEEILEEGKTNKEIIAECLSRSGVDVGADIDGKVEITFHNSCSDKYKFRITKIRVWYVAALGIGKKKYHDISGDWIVDNQSLPLSLTLNLDFKHGISIQDGYHLGSNTTIIKK